MRILLCFLLINLTANAPGTGIDGAVQSSFVEKMGNGEIVTTILLDIGEGTIVADNTADFQAQFYESKVKVIGFNQIVDKL